MGKIYTKKGDGGNTKTFKGEMSKSDDLAEAIGTIDELNSWIGFVSSKFEVLSYESLDRSSCKQLKNIQTNLMKINATLAGAKNSELELKSYEVKKLELWIDRMTGELPNLTNFIYPMGEVQVARAVCRRAERAVVRFFLTTPLGFPPILGGKEKGGILRYLNRLSDYLFTLARWINFKNGIKEEVWKV